MAFDLKNLKSLFVTEATDPKKAPAKTPASRPTPPPPDPEAAIVPESAAGQPGQVTDKFTKILFAAIERENLKGVDYLEYKQSLKSLEKMPMEEQVRYQSAFAMAQAMGATPQQLIQTAGHYVQVLKGEEAKFEQALAKRQSSDIANREEKIQRLNATIQQKAEQVKKLTEEMQKHRADMEKLSAEIGQAKSKMETTKNNFIASYNALVSQILTDVERMKKYLK